MDSTGALIQGAQDLTATKYLMVSGITVALYDWMLMFDDEVRYIWRGRKTWVFYLYILNRIPLIAYQVWEIYTAIGPRHSETWCLVAYYAQVCLDIFFFSSSDTFIALRIYAITFRNKLLAVYFGVLALARLAGSLVTWLIKPPAYIDLPRIPVDAFNLCGTSTVTDRRLKAILNSIGTTYDLSAFLVIAWCAYRNRSVLKVSALVRTIVAEATLYFLAMLAARIYIQLSLAFTEGTKTELSYFAYGLINPILTMRFAVSLKRSADPRGGQKRQLAHFSPVNFAGDPSSGTRVSGVCVDLGMDTVYPPNGRVRTGGPYVA